MVAMWNLGSKEVVILSYRGLLVSCIVLALSLECCAQIQPGTTVPNGPSPGTPSNARQIEVLLRSQFSVPPDYDIVFGAESRSDIAGFDKLPVTFVHQGKQTSVDFLISTDGSTLARLQRFDIRQNPALSIDVNHRPIRGNPDAKVEIISFDDLECPYCAILNNEILPETLDHYKGLIKVVYKDFPIEGHPWATRAAIDADCLASLNSSAYWAYVDYVHKNRVEINGPQMDLGKSFQALDNIAGKIGGQSQVVEPELAMCMKQQDQSVINSSLKLGRALGFDAAPQVFVDGERLPAGARPTLELWPAIDRALKAQGIEPPSQTVKTTNGGQTGR
jgi:protein-disulfide isomerase